MSDFIKPKYDIPMQAQIPSQLVNQFVSNPAMQGEVPINPEAVKQAVSDSYVGSRAADIAQEDQLKQLLYSIPIWYGLCQSMDWFAKKCRGEFVDTIEYKIGKAADGTYNAVTQNRFMQSKPMQAINGGIKNFGKWLDTNIVDKSKILSAVKETPSAPTNKLVLGQANGMKGFLLFDYPQVAENFVKPLKYAEDLDCYKGDMPKDKLDKLIKKTANRMKKGATSAERAAILECAEFSLLSPDKTNKSILEFARKTPELRAEIMKDLKAQKFGYKSHKEMTKILKNIQAHPNEVLEACRTADKGMYSKIWTSDKNLWTKIKGHFVGRKVYATEFANKLQAAMPNVNTAHKSGFAKHFTKLTNQILEGSTNRVAGGKLIAGMQAFLLAEALIKASKAEGVSEKFKSFAERFVELVGFFVFTPIAIQLMHRGGGIQYAGMSLKSLEDSLKSIDNLKGYNQAQKDSAKKLIQNMIDKTKALDAAAPGTIKGKTSKHAVQAYREVLGEFNETAKSAGFATDKAQYQIQKKALKNARRAGVKNPITRMFKSLGNMLTGGLETPEAFRKVAKPVLPENASFIKKFGAKALDFLKHPKNYWKNGGGSVVRIIVALGVLMPFLNKFGVKLSHAIFGRPKESLLDKEPETPKNPEEEAVTPEQQQLLDEYKKMQDQAQKEIEERQAANAQYARPDVYSSPTNLLNNVKNPAVHTTTNTTNTTNGNTTVNTTTVNNTVENKKETKGYKEPERNYVPSSEPVKLQGENIDPALAAIKRSEAAEKWALENLAMK